MTGFSFNTAFLLLLGIGGLWFVARFVVGPKRGAPGLKTMFSREPSLQPLGIGKDAIRTLLEDTRALVFGAADLRGLVLAGPFAVDAATPASTVTLIVLGGDTAAYSGKEWLARWAYPSRGHPISSHGIKASAGEVLHTITLRGSPPLAIHFVPAEILEAPASLQTALEIGATVIEDPSGLAEKLRLHWIEALRKARPAGD